jgi:hypothetical protein
MERRGDGSAGPNVTSVREDGGDSFTRAELFAEGLRCSKSCASQRCVGGLFVLVQASLTSADARLLHFLDRGDTQLCFGAPALLTTIAPFPDAVRGAAAQCVGDVLAAALSMLAGQMTAGDAGRLDFGFAKIDRFFTPGATSA